MSPEIAHYITFWFWHLVLVHLNLMSIQEIHIGAESHQSPCTPWGTYGQAAQTFAGNDLAPLTTFAVAGVNAECAGDRAAPIPVLDAGAKVIQRWFLVERIESVDDKSCPVQLLNCM